MRSTIIAVLLAFGAMLPLAGCGDNDNNNNGNDNTPNAARTPTPAARTATPVQTPTSVGTNQPTATGGIEPTVTATENTATPTQGPQSPTPTSTPTGGGATCTSGEHVMLDASLDKAFAAFAVTIAYPTSSVAIPGTGSAVGNRVVFAVSGGLTSLNDADDQGDDGVDDTLHASFASGVDNPPGKVFTITFDCTEGQPIPSAGDFNCTVVSASTSGADTIPDEVCSLTVR